MVILRNRKKRPVHIELTQEYCDSLGSDGKNYYVDVSQKRSDWSPEGDKIHVSKTLRRFKTITILGMKESEPLEDAILSIPMVYGFIRSGILKPKQVHGRGKVDEDSKPSHKRKRIEDEQSPAIKQDNS